MLALLETIRTDDNRYLGDSQLRVAIDRLTDAEDRQDQVEQFHLHVEIAYHQLRLGRSREAIEHYQSARTILRSFSNEVPPNVERDLILDLAVANLRLAETQNCVHGHTANSCLLPIRGRGIHTRRDGTKRAIKYLTQYLKRQPDDVTARWLLNIASMALGTYPNGVPKRFLIPPEKFESKTKFPRFPDITKELGLNVFSLCGGTIIDDFDQDGFLDLVNSTWNTAGQIRFFRNRGDGTFVDRTEQAGLLGLYDGLNMVQADYDNDGDLDILVLRGAWLGRQGRHPNSLLRNDGHARFRDVTFSVGLGDVHYPTQTAAWADYDNDGDLDLFIGNERFPCQLFENSGQGTFHDVAKAAGVRNRLTTKAVVWGDYDNDRRPDLYVSNLDGPNRLYHNNGDGTFTDVAARLGVQKPYRSFPSWFWDVNNDGVLDLYVSAYWSDVRFVASDFLKLPHEAEVDHLYLGDGRGGFREAAAEYNIARVTLPMGSNFGDLDNDGYPDFYLGTGYPAYRALMPNIMYHNLAGKRFADVSAAGGFSHLQKGHGVAFADLDNDGDQDVMIELGGAYPGDAFWNALFENPGFGNHWIKIRLVGRQSNRWGVGARIRADIDDAGTRRSVFKWVNSGGSFGCNPLRQEIGIGSATTIARLEVFWPTSGRTQVLRNVPADRLIEITEGADGYRSLDLKVATFHHRPTAAKPTSAPLPAEPSSAAIPE